jgi:LytS/YehU family sensor histidine kinase
MERLRLEVAAKEAQLRSLVAQINPHFFFNCLNGLRALITEDPARAQQMVTDLSSLLRYALQSGKTQTVPLRTELETVRTYLELQRLRLEERLAVEIEAAPESLAVPVPTMLVQLLVENGVTHGIEARPQGGRIQVASWVEGPALRVRVINSGRLGGQSPSTRLGLENARERLALLYGGAATLRLDDGEDESVVAELTLPLAPPPPGTLPAGLA